jgi:hypothetical protein
MSNFQLYHGKNKVYSNEIMMTITALYYIPTLLYLYSDGGCTQCLLIVVFVPVLHTHFSPYSFPPEKWVYTSFFPRKDQYILIFPPGKISIYSSFPLIFRGEIWVYTEVSPSYSILPLCTDRLYKANNSYKGSTLWRLL